MTTHLVIPDTQVKPGAPTDHLRWIGRYILDRKPDRIIHLGDHWDLPSLSSYDKGKGAMEGRRYRADVDAGNRALKLLTGPTERYNVTRLKRDERPYSPDWHLLRGNHEERICRAIEQNIEQLEGIMGLDDLESPGWAVHDFLHLLWLDGVAYSHYFYNPMNGRPFSGQVATRLKTIGHSFTMGHQQTLDYALRFVGSGSHHGLVAGACYLHDEDYKGPQGNAHWRGIVVKHEVAEGAYDPMFVSLNYLCRKYEGVSLAEFMAERYPDL